MGMGTWSWIVPDGLWEIAKPLIPPSRVRPQGGGTQDTSDETLFATIIYVLVSSCAWRQLPPCFGTPTCGQSLRPRRPAQMARPRGTGTTPGGSQQIWR